MRLARSAPGEPGGLAGERVEVDLLGERLAAGVDLEDLPAPAAIGAVHDDLAVEAPGAQQCRVEDVGTVGGGDEDDVVLHLEAVHLDQQLVEGLLALVVAAAHAGAAMAADGVDLVHEDDARRVLLRLLEQVADPAGADADEHLDEVRARDREEGDPGLAGDGSGEQGLSGPWRPVEQHALGDPRPERLELLRVLEELLDLVQLLHGLVGARDVPEGDLRRVDRHPLRTRLAEAHHARATALHLVHQEEPETEEEDEREDVGEDREEARAAGALDVGLDPLALERVEQHLLVLGQVADGVLVAVLLGDRERLVLLLEGDRIDLVRAVVDLRLELRERRSLLRLIRADQPLGEEREHDHDQDRERGASEEPSHRAAKGVRSPARTWISVPGVINPA